MLKIQIDPITHVILAVTKVMGNTPVYKEDILVDERKVPDVTQGKIKFHEDGTFEMVDSVDGEMDRLARINEELAGLGDEKDYSWFIGRILEGKTANEAARAEKQRGEKIAALKAERDVLTGKHEKEIKDYYLKMNREADAKLACRYYSAVILLIKDENRYLAEWIDWHLNLKFQHIYIYDNGSKEDVQDIVSAYPEETRGKITVIDWRGHHTHIQQDAYNHFMEHYKADVRWGLFIDSDEFIKFTDGETQDVNIFLKEYEDYTEIWGYEVEYGANGEVFYSDLPVKERFTKRSDVRLGFYWKNFIQVNRIDSFLMHYAYYDAQRNLLFKNESSNQDLFVIEHYYTKSWEEWKTKIKERGGADPRYHKILSEFFLYNPELSYLDTGDETAQAYEGGTVDETSGSA